MQNKDDFKYVLQDTGHVFFGKELSYQEMMDKEDVPFKWKAIIGSYISKDVDLSTTLVEHLSEIDEKSFSFRIFEQIKMEVKYCYQEEKRTFLGKKKIVWVHKTCAVRKITQLKQALQSGSVIVEEVSVSKLALMTISI